MKRYTLSALSLAIALFTWWFLTKDLAGRQKMLYPDPVGLLRVGADHWISLLGFAMTTWYRVVVGLGLGGFIGFAFALLMSASVNLERIFDPFIEILRPIPPIALTPFFILWFGLSDFGQLLLVGLGCFMVVLVSTLAELKNVNPVWVYAAKSLGAKKVHLYLQVYIPAVIPTLVASIRVAAATGFALTVASEYLGAQGGLGFVIRNARTTLETDSILLCALILGLESLATDACIRRIGCFATSWMSRVSREI